MKRTNTCKTWLISALTAIFVVTLALAINCFANKSAFSVNATETGINGVNISLQEDIVVKFHTGSTTGDGTKLVVNFNGKTTEITENGSGVFSFAGVTPQNLNDEMTATLYASDGTTQIGEARTVSVQSYLETLLATSYEDSNCESELQYAAMKELAVNMLNYGAAAQIYKDHDVENLANKNLTPEQKELATETIEGVQADKQVNGDMWIGAGVRFDSRLGLYFIFQAESLDGISATINTVQVVPEVYDESKNWYVIRYDLFNATNMNDVITAKLTVGETEQMFGYSIKSYVAAKGGNGDALSNLVNATYAYGYSAVAYSAEYILAEDATLEKAGKMTMDGKGYDFSQSQYGEVEIPQLNLVDYTTSASKKSGSDKAPVVETEFKYERLNYSVKLQSNDYIDIEGKKYSKYNVALASTDDMTLEWSDAGYKLTAKNPVALKWLRAFGTTLTLVGEIDFTINNQHGLQTNNELVIGTETETATVTVSNTSTSTGTTTGIAVWNSGALTIEKDSSLFVTDAKQGIWTDQTNSVVTINGNVNLATSTIGIILDNATDKLLINEDASVTIGSCTYAIVAFGSVTIDGELDATGKVVISGAVEENSSYEYGFIPKFFVRKGTANITGQVVSNSIQVGSEKDGYKGTLNVVGTGSAMQANSTYGTSKAQNTINYAHHNKNIYFAYANGSLTLTREGLGDTAMYARGDTTDASVYSHIIYGSGIVVTLNNGTKNYNYFMGAWAAVGTFRYSIHENAKFNLASTVSRFIQNCKTADLYVTYYGDYVVDDAPAYAGKQTFVAAGGSETTIKPADILTVDNGDGTKSIAPVVEQGTTLVAGDASTTISTGNLGTFASTTTSGVYYKVK